MVMLTDVSENGINANLKKRFANNQIYTYERACVRVQGCS